MAQIWDSPHLASGVLVFPIVDSPSLRILMLHAVQEGALHRSQPAKIRTFRLGSRWSTLLSRNIRM